jgi:hypothetical protein
LKRFNRLFQEAERLAPPPDLWKRIEAKSDLAPGRDAAFLWGAPALRAAAAVVLAVGVLGLGVMLQKRTGSSAAYANSAVAQESAPAETERESEIVDPELLGWHADLGELDDEVVEAEEAEEML